MKKLFRRSQQGSSDRDAAQQQQAGHPHLQPQEQQSSQIPQQPQYHQQLQQQYYQSPQFHPQMPPQGHGTSAVTSQFQNLSVQPAYTQSPGNLQQIETRQNYDSLSPQPLMPQARQRSSSGGQDMVAYLLEQGDSMVAKNDFAGAATTYTLAIQNDPTDSDLLVKRAYAFRMCQPPKLNEALADCQAASRSNPYDWKVWAQLGQVHLQNKDPFFAVEAFERSVEIGGSQVNSATLAAMNHAKAMVEREVGGSSSTAQPAIQVSQPPAGSTSNNLTAPVPASKCPAFTTNNSLQPAPVVAPPPARSPAPPVQQNVTSAVPANLVPAVNDTALSGVPPSYTPNATSSNPTVRGLSQQALATQLTSFETELGSKLRGALSLKAYTGVDRVDQVKLLYVGLQQHELTARELGLPTFAHPSFANIYVSMAEFPGSTYMDMDPETHVIYDGNIPGTLSVSGYSEEYRQQQYNANPRVTVALQQPTPLPDVTTDFLAKRIQSLVNAASHPRTDASLKEVLGNSPQLTGTNVLQTQIEALCYTLNRREPKNFALFTKAGRNILSHVFGSADQGNGVKKFLHQICLGYELLIRLRAETRVVSYAGLMTDEISTLVWVADKFMKNVDVKIKTDVADLSAPSRFTFSALYPSRQSAALIRFAELMKWPYMDEVREYCENAFSDILAGRFTVFDIYDFYYGLQRPGSYFRFQLMSCLRYATPKIRAIGNAPYFNSGVVIADKAYWPRTTVLGRVLGGSKTVGQYCGWVGPCMKPSNLPDDFGVVKKDGTDTHCDGGYVELTARAVTCAIPCSAAADSSMQYQLPDEDESTYVAHLVNVDNWIPALGPVLASSLQPRDPVKLQSISVVNVAPPKKAGDTDPLAGLPLYRATLHFTVGTKEVKYTLFSNPFFVSASPCVGDHPLYSRNIQKLARHTYTVANLKDAYQDPDALLVIDALSNSEDGDEEMLARAWCAERGLSAVIRRGKGCCFSCAVSMATQRVGLGFKVVICS